MCVMTDVHASVEVTAWNYLYVPPESAVTCQLSSQQTNIVMFACCIIMQYSSR